MNKIKNALPKSYRAFYIIPGLADYPENGIGTVLVQKPALDRIAPTYLGKPVVNLDHTDKEPEELFELSKNSKPEDFADGIIAATGYDGESGWHWMDFLVWDQDTITNIDENGFSVSCAYDVTESDTKGGTYNNLPYDEEVLDGVGLHLAIVPNPRYERSWIVKNSLPGGQTVKITFKKKKPIKNAEPVKDPEVEKEEIDNAEDAVIELPDGTEVPLSEAMAAYEKNKTEMDNAGKRYNMDDEIDVDGEKMSVKDFMNKCGYNMGEEEVVENAEPAQDVVAEPVIDEKKQMNNQKPEKNANFTKVKNAAQKDAGIVNPGVTTSGDRIKKGKSRYGTPVDQGGK